MENKLTLSVSFDKGTHSLGRGDFKHMKALLGWLGAPLIATALSWYCSSSNKPAIEADLMAKTQSALELAKVPGIMVDADGLRVILKGEVPDEATKQAAGLVPYGVLGVMNVQNDLVVKAGKILMTRDERTAAVDCQKEFSQLLTEPIRFATASAVVAPESFPLLNQLVRTAGQCPKAQIEIGGHTDARGAREMNIKLSQDRAASVRAYLVQKGIAAERLSSTGYGPDKPIGDNATPSGMEKNRRTEFVVKGL
jgi:outer membrane protein OmpA-like peptidoglycan-associated protein